MSPSSSERLKLIRKELGNISQQKLADNIGISVNRIKAIEAGKYNITSELAIKLESFCHFNFKWIMTGLGGPYDGTSRYQAIHLDDSCMKEKEKDSLYNGTAVELDHIDIVRRFKNKRSARDINRDLLELERINPKAFEKACSYIKGMLDYASVNSVDDYNGQDRRSGQDRRKVGQ